MPQDTVRCGDAESLRKVGLFRGDEEDTTRTTGNCPTSLSRASATPHANLHFPRLLNQLPVNHRTDLCLLGLFGHLAILATVTASWYFCPKITISIHPSKPV